MVTARVSYPFDLETFFDSISASAPALLHHYTRAAGALGILHSKEIWATNIHFLNDRMELQHGLDLANGCIEMLRGRSMAPPVAQALGHISAALGKVRQINLFVTSLSEAPDLLSQWRAYCPQGGYSLGFDSSHLRSAARREGFRLVRCIYSEAEQREILERLIAEYSESVMTIPAEFPEMDGQVFLAACRDFATDLTAVACSMKHAAFSEEREWRLISPPVRLGHPSLMHSVASELIVPRFKCSLLGDDEDVGLREIVVGPTLSPQLASTSLLSLARSVGLKVTVRFSSAPYRG